MLIVKSIRVSVGEIQQKDEYGKREQIKHDTAYRDSREKYCSGAGEEPRYPAAARAGGGLHQAHQSPPDRPP